MLYGQLDRENYLLDREMTQNINSDYSVEELQKADLDINRIHTELTDELSSWRDGQLSAIQDLRSETLAWKDYYNAEKSKLESLALQDNDLETMTAMLREEFTRARLMSGKGKIKGKYDSSDTRGTLERSIQSVMWSKDAFDSKLFKQQRKPPYTLPSDIFYACKLFAVHFILILAAFVCFRSPYGLQLMFSITMQNIAIVSLLSFILCIIQFISRAIASIPISYHVIMSDIRYGFKLFLVTLALAAISVIGLYLLGSGQLPYNTQSVRKEIFVPSVVLWVLWFVAYKIVSGEFFTRNGFISDTDNQQHGVVVNINWCFSFILCISWWAYDHIYSFDSDTSQRRRFRHPRRINYDIFHVDGISSRAAELA